MLKVTMSLLTVSLLVITLASTTANAARLDQPLTSTAAAAGKLNADGPLWLPYYVCKSLCPGRCSLCNRAAPCGASCICDAARDSTTFKKAAAAAAAIAADQQATKVKADWCLFPTAECSDKCPGVCVCSLILPTPEYCYCSPRPVANGIALPM